MIAAQYLLVVCLLVALLPSAGVAGQSTTWIGGAGDWADPSNWTDSKVPTADHVTRIPAGGFPVISAPGAVCNNLEIGIDAGAVPAELMLDGGDLTANIVIVGFGFDANLVQFGDTDITQLIVGSAGGTGDFTMHSGTATLGTFEVGSSTSEATVTHSGGAIDVLANMTIFGMSEYLIDAQGAPGSLVVANSVNIAGSFAVAGPNQTIQIAGNFSMVTAEPQMFIVVTDEGLAPIEVANVAELAGTLLVGDEDAAPGTYKVLEAGTISGTFSTVSLPPGWTWEIGAARSSAGGNAVYLTKTATPVESTTWSGIKNAYR